ncbi:hypothetical protein L484_015346 [Morus notabilis]|uniref:Galactose oxidase n=1 Tax=Morus notabilis TaxID=981085 RepID=W9RMJ9_9ROSA|nr:aldehyde oxidase GLOX1 [Morus notabilis]EXB81872.1 hypothetical protein L484_015346 [Morus notabilis]
MAAKTSFFLLIAITTCLITSSTSQTPAYRGRWRLLKRNIGISAMHMALLPNDKIIVFDRTSFGPSNLTLPQAKCHIDSTISDNCFAHSVEFDLSNRAVRPLTILTDTWCSSGALSSSGVLVQTGGFEAGELVVRYFQPCAGCDWVENPNGLIAPRWYSSNQVLPDGRIIVVGGRLEFSYEFIPKSSKQNPQLYKLPFLEQTRYSAKVPNNLYPFLHLSPDGNLFIFANDRAILLDYASGIVVRQFPTMPDGNGAVSRNYPSTGSSALLPIFLSRNDTVTRDAVVLVCGGTASDANVKASAGEYVVATRSCGRISITEEKPEWEMEEMPVERVMGDMILLPTGDVLIINGARKGTAGWDVAREPVLYPVLYRTGRDAKTRFEILSPSIIPRLYHSTAHLLPDGRVLVGGSNPNRNYNFSTVYPTELSLETFYPPYLNTKSRPLITNVEPGKEMAYKQRISVRFRSSSKESFNGGGVYVTMVAPSFTTHSFAMNQRLLVLDVGEVMSREKESNEYVVEGHAPPTPAVAPPGYYLLFVVVHGAPSRGMWIRIK